MSPTVLLLDETSVPTLVEIERESNSPPWSAPLFIDEFRSSYAKIYGIAAERKIVGFLVCHLIFEEAHIANFAVRKSERGKGYGRSLILAVLKTLKAPPLESVTLEVRRGNTAAISLYQSLGFQEVGVRPRYYVDPIEDALILTLRW